MRTCPAVMQYQSSNPRIADTRSGLGLGFAWKILAWFTTHGNVDWFVITA